MKKLNRRALLSSIGSSILFAASPASALGCDVTRSRRDGVSSKTYSCQFGQGRSLSATFVRMSDVVADTLRDPRLPAGYETLLEGSQIIENGPLATFEDLTNRFSFPIEPEEIEIIFDGRNGSHDPMDIVYQENKTRFRTLGVWDDPKPDKLPFFPLPDELNKAFSSYSGDEYSSDETTSKFLRYATAEDFKDLDRKKKDYFNLWSESSLGFGDSDLTHMHHLDLMTFIQAGSVNGFLPLFFYPIFSSGCSGKLFGGAHYAPPALYVDAMVCENTGSKTLKIEDFFGASETVTHLRSYSPATPDGESMLGWSDVELSPGESVVAIQRLLFKPLDQKDYLTKAMMSFSKTVFGPTQLPKGVVVDGERFAFDGRSHNVLIVASHFGGGSCPYLMSWCEQALEWVELGKVITGCSSSKLEGEECRDFDELRLRFKLIEREHERTFIRSLSLEIKTHDGAVFQMSSPAPLNDQMPDWPVVLEIGRMFEFAFDLPDGVQAKDVSKTKLRIRGHYEQYTQHDFEDRRRIALAEA